MRKIFLRYFGLLLVLAAGMGAAAAQTTLDDSRYGYGHSMMGWDGGWTMIFFGPLFMIITLAAVVAAIVFLVRWLGGAVPGAGPLLPSQRTPIDVLKERYAKGEIDKTEFEERRRVLGE